MAATARSRSRGGRPPRLAVFPVYRDNPYLNLMLLAPRASGWDVLESARLERFEQDLASLGTGDVAHVHWTAPIVQRADDTDEAADRLGRFRTAVDNARTRGARILWTVHNALAHDVRHEDLEIALNRYLATTADVVHVMNTRTPDAVAAFYDLSGRTVEHIPHPSYRGIYDGVGSRAEARSRFGLDDDEIAVLFFGQIRPYKGVDVLIEALERAEPARRFVLLLAGRTSAEDEAIIDRLLPDGLRTVRHHDYVDDADVKVWFDAADVAVLPYRRILNSGSLHLAATFGVPAVLPDEPHLRSDFGSEPWIRWFEPGDPGALARVLSGPVPERGASRAFTTRLSPFAVSRRYDALLRDMTVGRSDVAASGPEA
ncbi:glycosyltransferase [Curtobacterium sp. PhB115]|uniref:glycosyltransferase n=1 Tax=Curtobacterium sp. PhB115 TaxID=2485173 RepID=UPI000F4B68DC|nr:glycosyltransferase [Curtobacterium sp. PhB115]ROP63991.1 glycosyl transferase family 1 [Curtobacterium sp. PhB115]